MTDPNGAPMNDPERVDYPGPGGEVSDHGREPARTDAERMARLGELEAERPPSEYLQRGATASVAIGEPPTRTEEHP